MLQSRRQTAPAVLAALVTLIVFAAVWAHADTITQTNAEGQRLVIQTDAIVTQNDSYAIVYKHFDLGQRRVVLAKLDQGSLPYSVVLSSPAQRQQIVNLWKQFGYSASVVTQAGKKIQVYDAYLDFFPGPGGIGAFLESVPPRTNLPLLLDSGGADEIDFGKIVSIRGPDGHLTVALSNGKVETGRFLMPTRQPAVVHFMGITDSYKPDSKLVYDFSMPLSEIKEIHFENDD
jgi:hypothetical protein